MENQDYKLENFYERVPIFQVARFRSKKQSETKILIKKKGFRAGIRGSTLNWENIETFYGSWRLDGDQLLDINHTQN